MDSQPRTVAAVIPAYNEQGRVGIVVKSALDSGLFAEIVVVDDGSSDLTESEARDAGADLIKCSANRGKPAAMQEGIGRTTSELICFLDADLLNISKIHLTDLLEPVLSGEFRAAIAVFRGGRASTTLAQKIAPLISGQRCLERGLLIEFDRWDSGFGIETALNDFLKHKGIDQQIVYWDGASHVMKEEKRGWLRGLMARLSMYWQILITWFKTKSRTKSD